ncbi:MAG: 50S ribosomal protein L3 N(5)-glutamine methyltransferase [Pseudomonadota bacterium]
MSSLQTLHDTLRRATNGWQLQSAVTQAFEAAELHYGHGTDCAADEATWLFAAVHDIEYSAADWQLQLQCVLDAPPDTATIARIAELAHTRIATRQPLAYLLGEAWFAGLKFMVNEQVLVPRSPIGELIGDGFAPWLDGAHIDRVLDIGTGSGCIAIATALALPHAQVHASDVCANALACAATNVAYHGLADRVTLHQSDVFDGLSGQRFDLIVSNPPYVDADEMHARPAEYRHEPELGLAAGHDGLSIARRLLAQAPAFLNDGGHLILEVGASDEALQREYAEVPFIWLTFADDAQGVTILDKETLIEHHELFAARMQETPDAG